MELSLHIMHLENVGQHGVPPPEGQSSIGALNLEQQKARANGCMGTDLAGHLPEFLNRLRLHGSGSGDGGSVA